jgi:hypothetical protein
MGGRDLAVELQGEVRMPFRGLAWTEEGWRRELGGGPRVAAMAGGCGELWRARVERGRGEVLVRDANERGQSFAVRPGEVEDAALGSALMASGVATVLSPSSRRLVACSTEQRVSSRAGSTGREGRSAGLHSWPGSKRGVQRRSELVLECPAASAERRKGEREREKRERKKKGQRFDSFQTQKFQWKLEKF